MFALEIFCRLKKIMGLEDWDFGDVTENDLLCLSSSATGWIF